MPEEQSKEQSKKETQLKTQTVSLRYLHMAPRKVRAIAALVKGLPVNEAEAQLLLQSRRAAQPILKLLRSAKASAKNNLRLEADNLYVSEARVDQGPMLKRMLPRARGTATPIQKKMSHITLVLKETSETKKSRFNIVVKKKVKLPSGEKIERGEEKEKLSRKPKTQKGEPVSEKAKHKQPGFFRRIFNRKSV